MSELIDKAKLIEYLAAIKPDEYVSAYGEAAVDVINHVEKYVAEMPTIEPEVRRGRWITRDSKTAKCSYCGWWQHAKTYYLPDDIHEFSKCYRFCTSCGSRMDGGADNA